MVAGDLNAHIGDWSLSADVTSNDVLRCDVDEEGNRQSQDKITNQFGKILIDFCTTFHCTPLNGNHTGDENGQFTFVSNQGNSVIDYFIVSVDLISKLNMNFVVRDHVESSHMPLQLNINSHPNTKGKTSRNKKKKESTTLKWNREKMEYFLEAIHSEESQSGMQKAFQFLDSCTDSALKKFTETLLQAAESMRRTVWFDTGHGRDTNRWYKYYNCDCLRKKREARRALNRFQKTGLDVDKATYREKRSEYKSTVSKKKKQYKITIHQALLDNKRNSNKFCETVRSARRRRKKQPEIDIKIWQNHFQTILGQVEKHDCSQTQAKDDVQGSNSKRFIPELDNPITEQEVRQAIKNLKTGKASGLDNICAEFLKYAENFVVPFLTKLFNKLYDTSYFPLDWCKSVIIPLFKKGEDSNPDNYRGISLLSVVSKVFTAILNKRLYAWAENEEKISKQQAGFREGYSTIDHIFTLITMVKSKLDSRRGGKVYVAFIDYKKAFDTVDWDKLWETLEKIKTSSKMVNILKAMYFSVQ